MHSPSITPVLTGQPQHVVNDVLRYIFSQLQRKKNEDQRTRVWFISKALQWVHFNSQAFINSGSRGETVMRKTFEEIWGIADSLLEPCVAKEMRQFSDYLCVPARNSDADFVTILSTPHFAKNYIHLMTLLKLSMDLFYIVMNNSLLTQEQRMVWRVLIMAQTFDILYSNPQYLNFLGTYFTTIAVSKWRENGELWPFFMRAYPLTVIEKK